MNLTASSLREEIGAAPHLQSSLILTGHEERRRHLVLLRHVEIFVPGTTFEALVDLVLALLTTRSRQTCIPSAANNSPAGVRLIIHRLRREIDKGLGKDAGKRLIGTVGNGNKYFLQLDRSEVSITDSFLELKGLDPGILDAFQVLFNLKRKGNGENWSEAL
jgi:hypothetical protein